MSYLFIYFTISSRTFIFVEWKSEHQISFEMNNIEENFKEEKEGGGDDLAASLKKLDSDSMDDLTEEQRKKLFIYPSLLERRDSFSSLVPSTITNFDSSHSASPIIKAFYDAIGDGMFLQKQSCFRIKLKRQN